MSKCCVICVGRNADRAADRIEAYAKKADFEIVETIFKDTKSVERLKFYIERDSIISILVSSIYDISSDKDVVKGIMELAAEHGIRPVVIVSNDSANRHSTVFHAVPLTSKIHKKTYLPTHIFISSFKAVGLRTNSIAQCEQLCDVKDTDLIEKIGKVSKNQLRQITKGMQIQLGMSTKHNNPIA